MDFKNMKVSIGIVITIIAQAFGIIWYVAQLDSTVGNLNTTVYALEEQATNIDIAVLNTDVEAIMESADKMMQRTGEFLDVRLELNADAKVGKTWADTH